MRKCILFIILTIYLSVLLAGCSIRKEESSGITQNEQKDYVYVADNQDFVNPDSIRDVCAEKDILYIATHNDETNEERFYKTDLLTKRTIPIRLEREESESCELQQMTVDRSDNFVLLEKICKSEENRETFHLRTYVVETGELQKDVEITALLPENEKVFVSGLAVDSKDYFYLLVDKTILVIEADGKLLFELHPNVKWFQGIVVTTDGIPVVLATSETEDGLILCTIDTTEKRVAKSYNIKGNPIAGRLAASTDGKLYISCNDEVSIWDITTGKQHFIFSWSENNLNAGYVRQLIPLSDGNFAAVLEEPLGTGFQNKVSYLAKTLRSEADMRKVLVLGTLENYQGLQDIVTYFNSNNEKYRIEIKSYASAGTSEEGIVQAGIQMKMDLMSGNAMDIINPYGLDGRQLAASEIVEDLTPYLEADEELGSCEFFDSLMNANTIGGKLCCLPPYFNISTVFGRQSEVGIESGVSVQELVALIENCESGRRVYASNQDSLVKLMLTQNFQQFIDWENGICRLDSEDFLHILEFSKKFGMTMEEEEKWIQEIANGARYEMAMLETRNLNNGLSYVDARVCFGEPVTAIGFPVTGENAGNGAVLENINGFLMHTQSLQKEGVWEFLRTLLMPEYYQKLLTETPENMFFPARRDVYEQAFEKWMETEQIQDENGQEQIVSKYEFRDLNGQSYRELLTEQDKETVTALIESAAGGTVYNYDINKMIEEETGAYFAGQKSADEVAAIIQNRVQLYVNENR